MATPPPPPGPPPPALETKASDHDVLKNRAKDLLGQLNMASASTNGNSAGGNLGGPLGGSLGGSMGGSVVPSGLGGSLSSLRMDMGSMGTPKSSNNSMALSAASHFSPRSVAPPPSTFALPVDFDESKWNQYYQELLEAPEPSFEDAFGKGLRVQSLQEQMLQVAVGTTRQIIDEYPLPARLKTVQPIDIASTVSEDKGEAAEDDRFATEDMYIEHGLLFRIVRGGTPHGGAAAGAASSSSALEVGPHVTPLLGDVHMRARKEAGNEIRSMSELQQAATKIFQLRVVHNNPGGDDGEEAGGGAGGNGSGGQAPPSSGASGARLCTVLSCVVDYCGYRVFVMTIPPVEGARTCVYGRVEESGEFIATHQPLRQLMADCAKELNLKAHDVVKEGSLGENGQYRDQNDAAMTIVTSVDTQGHLCSDNRLYVVNLAKQFPPDLPLPGSEESSAYQLRPELVRNYHARGPLSSDAFRDAMDIGDLGDAHDRDNTEVAKASQWMREHVIPDLCATLDSLEVFVFDGPALTDVLHAEGVNVRHLGRIAELTRLPHVRTLTEVEMVARVCKNVLNASLRRLRDTWNHPTFKTLGESAGGGHADSAGGGWQRQARSEAIDALQQLTQDCVVDFFNLVLGGGAEVGRFWTQVLLPSCRRKFEYPRHESEIRFERFDRSRLPLLFAALQHQTNFRFRPDLVDASAFGVSHSPLSQEDLVQPEGNHGGECGVTYMRNHSLDTWQVAKQAESFLRAGKFDLGVSAFKVRALLEGAAAPNGQRHVRAMLGVAEAYLQWGKYEEALEWAVEHALPHAKGLNPLAPRAQATIMRCQYLLGDEPAALSAYQAAIKSITNVFGPGSNHPLLSEVNASLGELYYADRTYDAALTYLEKAKTVAGRALGRDHPLVATYCTQLGHVHLAAGSPLQAIQMHEDALLLFATTHGEGSTAVANSSFFLAEAYTAKDALSSAEEAARVALRIRETELPPGHEHVLNSWHQLANIYDKRENLDQALAFFQRILVALKTEVRAQEERAVRDEVDMDLNLMRDVQRVTQHIIDVTFRCQPYDDQLALHDLVARAVRREARGAGGKQGPRGGRGEKMDATRLPALPRVIKGLFDAEDAGEFAEDVIEDALNYVDSEHHAQDEEEEDEEDRRREQHDYEEKGRGGAAPRTVIHHQVVQALMCVSFLSDDENGGGWWLAFERSDD